MLRIEYIDNKDLHHYNGIKNKGGFAMRKKLKPDLNLEEIQQSLINETVELYNSGLSLRKTAEKLSMSPMKVRKILLTAGVYTSSRQKDIKELYDAGYSIEEIAEIFHVSISNVYTYLPYESVIYNMKEKSVNAERQARYRQRKKNNITIEKPEIIKLVIEKRNKGIMYLVINQGLRKYLPKDIYDEDYRDPLERYIVYTGKEKDPNSNIWNADVIVTGRGKDKIMAIVLENACCGFRIVTDMIDDIDVMDVAACRNALKEKILSAIRDNLIMFDIPADNVDNYISNNSREFIIVKAKNSFPSHNVLEFKEELETRINDGLDFKTIFSLEYNRTNRKFGYSREYRDVDMATYHMLGLTEEETMEIFKKRWEKTIKKE